MLLAECGLDQECRLPDRDLGGSGSNAYIQTGTWGGQVVTHIYRQGPGGVR